MRSFKVWGAFAALLSIAAYAQVAHATNCACDTMTGYFQASNGMSVTSSTSGVPGILSQTSSPATWGAPGIDARSFVANADSPGAKGTNTTSTGIGVWGVGGAYGGRFEVTGSPPSGASGVRGSSSATNGYGGYFDATGTTSYGVYASGTNYGVYASGTNYGIYTTSPFIGGKFNSTATTGTAYGIQAFCNSNNCTALYGGAPAGQTALYASGNATVSGNAFVIGTMTVNGYLTKAGGGFRIDHPEHPDTMYLNHGFVESEVAKNLYDGSVTLDAQGNGTITMPSYYNKVNKNGRLFADGVTKFRKGPGQWTIKGLPNQEVEWLIVATRNDAWAQRNQPPTEAMKSVADRGKFQNPEIYGKGPEFALTAAQKH